MILLKSKIYREEILRWVLILALFAWAMVATVIALRAKPETLLIGLDDHGARLITDQKDRLLVTESTKLIQNFVDLYYSYNEVNHGVRVGHATDLMTEELWKKLQPELAKVQEKLSKEPLTEVAEIDSIDQLGPNRIQVLVSLTIKQRMSERVVKIRLEIGLRQRERTSSNPYGFEIVSLSESTI